MTETPLQDADRRTYRGRRLAVGVVAIIAILAGYCAVIAGVPLPALHVTLADGVEAQTEFTADTASMQAAVDAQALPSAVGWLDSDEVWSNSDASYRIASMTKLITVLVGLEAAPVEAGTDGPTYTLTEADAALVDEVLAQDGSFAPAPIGLELTTRQILDLVLVPSANNYAISYARWIFGSDEAFVTAATDWLARNGLSSVHIEEASGLSDNNVAQPADIIKLARLALANPLVADIVSQSVINIPQLGEITTTNRLLGDAGVIGLKTGTTFPNGYSLVAAQHQDFGGRDLVAIAVTMDRADSDMRATDTRAVLAAASSTGWPVQFTTAGERIGTVTTWTGAKVPLLAAGDIATTLVPGESASRSITFDALGSGAKGAEVGEILSAAPAGDESVAVVTDAAIEEPNFIWRFTHPREVFGWR